MNYFVYKQSLILADMLKLFVVYVTVLFISYSGSNETGNNVLYSNDSLGNVGKSIKRECASFLKLFANATQHFNWCIVKHAKPLRMCEKCTAQYSTLLKRNPVNFNSSVCVDDLVKSERFQVVMKVYDFQTGLWESAHCGSKLLRLVYHA
jgi:hypothetical protein